MDDTEQRIIDQMANDSDDVKKERVRVASEQVVNKRAAQRYAAAFVFTVMLLSLVAIEIIHPNSPNAKLNTADLGDLIYFAGLLYSFWKAVG